MYRKRSFKRDGAINFSFNEDYPHLVFFIYEDYDDLEYVDLLDYRGIDASELKFIETDLKQFDRDLMQKIYTDFGEYMDTEDGEYDYWTIFGNERHNVLEVKNGYYDGYQIVMYDEKMPNYLYNDKLADFVMREIIKFLKELKGRYGLSEIKTGGWAVSYDSIKNRKLKKDSVKEVLVPKNGFDFKQLQDLVNELVYDKIQNYMYEKFWKMKYSNIKEERTEYYKINDLDRNFIVGSKDNKFYSVSVNYGDYNHTFSNLDMEDYYTKRLDIVFDILQKIVDYNK